MEQPIIIWDFDDTLFHTARFKADRKKALISVGVSADDFDETYTLSRLTNGEHAYTTEKHVAALQAKGYPKKQVEAAFLQVETKLDTYVLPHAQHVLAQCRTLGAEQYLLSLGSSEFQHLKVAQAKIAEYFSQIYYEQISKEDAISRIIKEGGFDPSSIWCINDKVDESLRIQEKIPGISIILKQSPTILVELYRQSGLPYFTYLNDIYDYLKDSI